MNRGPVLCAAPGCHEHVERGQWMCRAHWFALPARLRRALGATWRARHVSAFQQLWTEALVLLDRAPGVFDSSRSVASAEGRSL